MLNDFRVSLSYVGWVLNSFALACARLLYGSARILVVMSMRFIACCIAQFLSGSLGLLYFDIQKVLPINIIDPSVYVRTLSARFMIYLGD